MASKKYEKRAQELIQAIDVAVEVFEKFPPPDFLPQHISTFVGSYRGWQEDIRTAEPQFQNLKSLKYTEDDAFTFFQEAQGKCVEEFWKRIRAEGLPYNRVNKLKKIMKRGRIKDRIEYNFVIDVLGPYVQEGLIGEEEVSLLNQWIEEFEGRGSN